MAGLVVLWQWRHWRRLHCLLTRKLKIRHCLSFWILGTCQEPPISELGASDNYSGSTSGGEAAVALTPRDWMWVANAAAPLRVGAGPTEAPPTEEHLAEVVAALCANCISRVHARVAYTLTIAVLFCLGRFASAESVASREKLLGPRRRRSGCSSASCAPGRAGSSASWRPPPADPARGGGESVSTGARLGCSCRGAHCVCNLLVTAPRLQAKRCHTVRSHNFNSQNFKLRVSNPRTTAYLNLKMPFESSNPPEAGAILLD